MPIITLCRRFEIKLETFWISRDCEQIEYYDMVSKEVDTSDYLISNKDFSRLEGEFRPFEADYFASDRLWQMKPFFAKFGCGESEGVNVFAVHWDRGSGYCSPGVCW